MMVGVASGAYSSIFIATPVLTHWKEREPAYRARRDHLIEEMGHLPTFPEENVVARLGDEGEPVPTAPAPSGGAPKPAREVEPEPQEPEAVEPIEAGVGDGADGAPDPAEPEPLTAGAGREAARPPRSERQRKRRQQRRRRKHGRNR
jgi:SecD/SecF fusion protein